MPLVRCSHCNIYKDQELDFHKDSSKSSGYRSSCKDCTRLIDHRRKERGPTKILIYKICSICNVNKPADAFVKDMRRQSGLDARCKECRRAIYKTRSIKITSVVNPPSSHG